MKILLLADLHLTDKPSEEYRWKMFDWVLNLVTKNNIKTIFVLGDITDSKDKHSAALVNRLVDSLWRIKSLGVAFYIIMGNHDFIEPTSPFFGFLDRVEGITFVKSVYSAVIGSKQFLMIPNIKQSLQDRDDINKSQLIHPDYILMHETMNQSVGSNGHSLPGLKKGFFDGCKGRIFSGDIHVPQIAGLVEYIGSPYSIKFGDNFGGSGILIDLFSRSEKRVYFDSPLRLSLKVRSCEELQEMVDCSHLKGGDHLKVKVQLPRGRIQEWGIIRDEVKAFCNKNRIMLFGLALEEIKRVRLKKKDDKKQVSSSTPRTVLKDYARREKIADEVVIAGLNLLEG